MSAKPGRRRMFRVIGRVIWAIVILGAIGGGVWYYLRQRDTAEVEVAIVQQLATVMRGDIDVTISGAGPIAYSVRRQVKSEVKGTVLRANFVEGDLVKAGDIIFEVDNKEAMDSIARVQNDIKQQEVSNSSSATDIGSMATKAPVSGIVSGISVSVGENLNKGVTVMTITDKNNLSVTLPFLAVDAAVLTTGQSINLVNLDGELEYCPARITSIQNAAGGVGYVEISTQLSKDLKSGTNVAAVVGDDGIRALDTGTLAFKTQQTIKSAGTGTITGISVQENDYVTAGQTLINMKNTDVTYTRELNALRMESLQTELDAARETLDYYVIYAPIDGMFVSQPISKDDYIEVNQVVAEIVDPDAMEFVTEVDELDIDRVEVGQQVEVSFDAIASTTMTPIAGTVKKIAIEGSSSGGVTTYGVTVGIEPSGRVKAGMNADGVMYIESKSDVLYVPVEAVNIIQGNFAYVYVKSEEAAGPETAGAEGAGAGLESVPGGAPGGAGVGLGGGTGTRPGGAGGGPGGGTAGTGGTDTASAGGTDDMSGIGGVGSIGSIGVITAYAAGAQSAGDANDINNAVGRDGQTGQGGETDAAGENAGTQPDIGGTGADTGAIGTGDIGGSEEREDRVGRMRSGSGEAPEGAPGADGSGRMRFGTEGMPEGMPERMPEGMSDGTGARPRMREGSMPEGAGYGTPPSGGGGERLTPPGDATTTMTPATAEDSPASDTNHENTVNKAAEPVRDADAEKAAEKEADTEIAGELSPAMAPGTSGGQGEQQPEVTGQSPQGAGADSTAPGGFAGGERMRRFADGMPGTGYYEGSVMRMVEFGISNESVIEIVSGLEEGEIIVLPQVVGGTDAGAMMGFAQPGMMMQFGAPAGGGGGGGAAMRSGAVTRTVSPGGGAAAR